MTKPNQTAVSIGNSHGIFSKDFSSPLDFYKKIAYKLEGRSSYTSEMTFIVSLLEKLLNETEKQPVSNLH